MTIEEVNKISDLVDKINHLENVKKVLDSNRNVYFSISNSRMNVAEVVSSFKINGDGYNQDLINEIGICIDKYLSNLKNKLDSLEIIDPHKNK